MFLFPCWVFPSSFPLTCHLDTVCVSGRGLQVPTAAERDTWHSSAHHFLLHDPDLSTTSGHSQLQHLVLWSLRQSAPLPSPAHLWFLLPFSLSHLLVFVFHLCCGNEPFYVTPILMSLRLAPTKTKTSHVNQVSHCFSLMHQVYQESLKLCLIWWLPAAQGSFLRPSPRNSTSCRWSQPGECVIQLIIETKTVFPCCHRNEGTKHLASSLDHTSQILYWLNADSAGLTILWSEHDKCSDVFQL